MGEEWRERIVIDPKILRGKPVIRGTRISVELILELLAGGWTEEAITENYPQIRKEDISAALHYAHSLLKEEAVWPYP
jgi:uncharacterized protein (DUF433 family)